MTVKFNEIAKSIFDAIQVKVKNNSTTKFLNFSFKNGEFKEYFFTDDILYTTDDVEYGGIEKDEYINMSIEDIENELYYTYKESCN